MSTASFVEICFVEICGIDFTERMPRERTRWRYARNKLAFLDNVLPENVERRINEGVMIGAGRCHHYAEKGRRDTKRTMP